MEIPKNWTFEDKEVANAFDNHVRGQLPWYELASGIVSHVVRHYLPTNGVIYDIGASTGNIGRGIKPILDARSAELIEIEPAAEMHDTASYVGHQLIKEDACKVNYQEFDVATLFLVLMFIGVEERKLLLDELYVNLKEGGALIVFDKCVPAGGYVSTILSRLTLAGKMASNVTPEDIIAKELSTSGVQRPIAVEELPGNPIEIFRFGDFAGWIIEKEIV